MQDNVKGSPTIIEGTTRGDLYRWGNRFSIYTGLPSVIGWQWHQRQQRAALDERIVYDRDADLVDFYNTTDIGLALELIRRYDARYIVLGDLEQVYYDERGFGKFEKMVQDGYLRVALPQSRHDDLRSQHGCLVQRDSPLHVPRQSARTVNRIRLAQLLQIAGKRDLIYTGTKPGWVTIMADACSTLPSII